MTNIDCKVKIDTIFILSCLLEVSFFFLYALLSMIKKLKDKPQGIEVSSDQKLHGESFYFRVVVREYKSVKSFVYYKTVKCEIKLWKQQSLVDMAPWSVSAILGWSLLISKVLGF